MRLVHTAEALRFYQTDISFFILDGHFTRKNTCFKIKTTENRKNLYLVDIYPQTVINFKSYSGPLGTINKIFI